jgi:hypothetical protein
MEAKTWTDNPPDRYPLLLGKLLANITSLEFAIRAVLYHQMVRPDQRVPVATRFTSLKEGEEIEESPLTSWDSLGQLIAEYNRLNPASAIPADLKDVRDAFAHGRILADNPTMPLTLVRFSRPVAGKVRVEKVETLTEEWLGRQIKLSYEVTLRVHGQLAASS